MMDIQTGLIAGIAFDNESSYSDIVCSNSDVRHSNSDVRRSNSDIRHSNSNVRRSKDINKSNGKDVARLGSPNGIHVGEIVTTGNNVEIAHSDVLRNDEAGKIEDAKTIVARGKSDLRNSPEPNDVNLKDQGVTISVRSASPSNLTINDDTKSRNDIPRYVIRPISDECTPSLEVRKSIASSGIGADDGLSSRSSITSGDYSSCVSVTSLDDDDDDYLSSIFINTENRDIIRARSMNMTATPLGLTNRSVSMDDNNPPKNTEPVVKPAHVTVIRLNPGFESRLSTPSEDCDDTTYENNSNGLFYRNDSKRDQSNRHLNGFRSSLINLTTNPGYMKFIDEQGDESKTQLDDSSYECTNEGGVKFMDDDGDSICSSVESDEDKIKSKAPDGGWGWVIVAASFFISVIADGISFSFGLLYIEFLRHFGESSSKTSLIGSLFMSVPLLTGPISSALVDRYGCRIMTIIGGVIAGSGFVASAFQDSIEMMYLTFGLIAGLGLGLCYVTAVVSIAYWFDKKRTLATGLGACGTGFGTVVYARMTSYFIAEFGWRGTVLLLAGTLFNMCVGGALMRDPEWWTIEQGNKGTSVAGTKSIKAGSSCGSLSGFADVEQLRRLLKSGEAPEYLLTSLATTTEGDGKGEERGGLEEGRKAYRSVVNLPTFVRQSEKVPLEVLESLSANRRVFNVILENYPSLLLCRSVSDGNKLNAMATTARVPVTMSVRVEAANHNNNNNNNNSNNNNNHSNNNNNNNNNNMPAMDGVTGTTSPDTRSSTLLRQTSVPSEAPYATTDTPDSCTTPPSKTPEASVTPPSKTPEASVTPPSKTPPTKHKSILSKAVPRTDSLPTFRKQVASAQPSAHYLKNIRVHRNSVMYRGAMLNIHRYRLRASSCPDIYRNSMTTIAKENEEKWYGDMLDLLRGMVDFSMFLELHFLLMSIATILLFTWFIVPYFYLADHVTLNHYDEQQVSSLLMIIGVTNFIGMVGLGWAGDQPWMNVTKTYAFCLVVCGLATMAMPFFTWSYTLLACSCALFGLFFASSFSFTPVILVQLIPLERFTTAYGLSLMCQGIGSLVGPPLAGWIYDMTRTYDLSFYMAGVWIIVAGILMSIIPMTTNRKIWGSGPMEKDKMSLSDNRDASYA